MTEQLWQVKGRDDRGRLFCAGFVIDAETNRCTRVAPILRRYCAGHSLAVILSILPERWFVKRIQSETPAGKRSRRVNTACR